jgi:hypothetical protein
MTPNARTVLPTDLVALVSYDGSAYANQAMTRDRIGTQDSPHPLETALEQWFSFATGRHTCVSVKGPTLRGLVSARKRGSKQAWEIDCLIDATEGDSGVLMSLLDQITSAAGKSGAMKLFVRLPRGSEIEQAAGRCGFLPYMRERVYRLRVDKSVTHQAPAGLRRREKADPYRLFQLYTSVVPPEVRRIEGKASARRQCRRVSVRLRNTCSRGPRVRWLRVAGDGELGRFACCEPVLDDLIEAASARSRTARIRAGAEAERAETGVRRWASRAATSLRCCLDGRCGR